MPVPNLGNITGDDIQELLDSLEKQRKELEWILQSLDSTNVKELNADVINAGVIKAEHISVGSKTNYETGYSPGDLRIEMETQFEVIDGEINSRVKQTDFNLLGGRVATAESTLSVIPGQISAKVGYTEFNALGTRVSSAESSISVLPGQIESKVSHTNYNGATIASLINQSAANVTISAQHIDLTGIVRVADSVELGYSNPGSTKAIKFNGTDAWIYSQNSQLVLDASSVKIWGGLDLTNSSVSGLSLTAKFG